MARTVEAIIEEGGKVRLLEEIEVRVARRALVTVLDEAPQTSADDCARQSEHALAQDWNRPEEDAAWSHLQLAR
jgi:hypothetical protein